MGGTGHQARATQDRPRTNERARAGIGVAVALAVAVLAAMAPARAAAAWLDVPDGFVAEPAPSLSPQRRDEAPKADAPAADWQPLLTVRPEDGPFADLSAVHLRRVVGTVADPDAWLRQRVAADFGDESLAEDLLDSPDSPFADPAFDVLRDALPRLFGGLERLGQLPLQFCEGPVTAYNAAGSLRELACTFQVGPFRQFMTLRLQEVDGTWYYTLIRAMNERRVRHLTAIANSFQPPADGREQP